MRTLDIVAAALFILWIFGFVHILVAMGIVAAIQGLTHKHSTVKPKPKMRTEALKQGGH